MRPACRSELDGSYVQVGGSALLDLARQSLPFELTEGQEAALGDILGQMSSWPPMQCLLQVCVPYIQRDGCVPAGASPWPPPPADEHLQRACSVCCICAVCRMAASGCLAASPPPLLLQGDVGCGKTVVAFLALLAATGSGYQGAIMVRRGGDGGVTVFQLSHCKHQPCQVLCGCA